MEEQEKWGGRAESTLARATPDQAWSLIKHYCEIHTLLPTVADCRLVDGTDGAPGCVRRCTAPPVPDPGGGETTFWVEERLLAIDHVGRRYTYEVVGGNMGFGRYVATLSVTTEDGGGCRLEWSFEAEPVVGWTREGLVSYLQNGLSNIGEKILEAFKNPLPDADL